MARTLFEDIFSITDVDPAGKKFDRGKILVSRFDIFLLCCHLFVFLAYDGVNIGRFYLCFISVY